MEFRVVFYRGGKDYCYSGFALVHPDYTGDYHRLQYAICCTCVETSEYDWTKPEEVQPDFIIWSDGTVFKAVN